MEFRYVRWFSLLELIRLAPPIHRSYQSSIGQNVKLNKRPMGHIAHLRKQLKSLYNNIDKEKEKKH